MSTSSDTRSWSARLRDPAALFGLAFMIRLIGVSWGAKHPDERINQAVRVLSGDFTPLDHFYPQLNNYVSALGVAVMFALGRITGAIDGVDELSRLYFTDETSFLVAARCTQGFSTALVAPAAMLAARALGHDRRTQWMVGGVAALVPSVVWLSHLMKPQNGMSAALGVGFAVAIAYLARPGERALAVALGLALGVAQAFLQSAVFVAVPLALAAAALALVEARGHRSAVGRDIGLAAVAGVLAWSALFLPSLLQWDEFIAYQRIQSQMSLRSGSLAQLARNLARIFGSWTHGLNPVGLGLLPLALYASADRRLQVFGVATLASAVVVAATIGERAPPRLFVPFVLVSFMVTALALAGAARRKRPAPRWIGRVGLPLLLASALPGNVRIAREMLSPPSGVRVAAVVRELAAPGETKILSARLSSTGLTQSLEARRDAWSRHERLAERYGVELPARSRERDRYATGRGGWYIREIPWVFNGLEHLRPEEITVVKAFSWPPQPEEWTLDHWLHRGFGIIVARQLDFFLGDEAPPLQRDFHVEVHERCEEVANIAAARPLLEEESFTVFDCRAAGAAFESRDDEPPASEGRPRST